MGSSLMSRVGMLVGSELGRELCCVSLSKLSIRCISQIARTTGLPAENAQTRANPTEIKLTLFSRKILNRFHLARLVVSPANSTRADATSPSARVYDDL